LRRQRLEPARGGLRKHSPPFAILERSRGVLGPPRQRGGVFRGQRRQALPLPSQLGDPILGVGPTERFDLLNDLQPVRLFAGQQPRPLLLRRPLLLSLGNSFLHGIGRGVELVRQRVIDDHVGLQFSPRQPYRRQRRRRVIRILDGDKRFRLVNQCERTQTVVSAHTRLFFLRRVSLFLELPKLRPRPACRHLVATALCDRTQGVWVLDPFERTHRDIR